MNVKKNRSILDALRGKLPWASASPYHHIGKWANRGCCLPDLGK
jgi:hypothetical protein